MKNITQLIITSVGVFGIPLYFMGSRFYSHYLEYWEISTLYSTSSIQGMMTLGAIISIHWVVKFILPALAVAIAVSLALALIFLGFTKFEKYLIGKELLPQNGSEKNGNKNESNNEVAEQKSILGVDIEQFEIMFRSATWLIYVLVLTLVYGLCVEMINNRARDLAYETGEKTKQRYDEMLNDVSKSEDQHIAKVQKIKFYNQQQKDGIILGCNDHFCSIYYGGGARENIAISEIESMNSFYIK